jgi:hypothetical protein
MTTMMLQRHPANQTCEIHIMCGLAKSFSRATACSEAAPPELRWLSVVQKDVEMVQVGVAVIEGEEGLAISKFDCTIDIRSNLVFGRG